MQLKNKYSIFEIFRLPFRSSPGLTTICLVDKLLASLVPSMTILATASFIDSAIAIFNGRAQGGALIAPLIYIALLIAYQSIEQTFMNFILEKQRIRMNETFRLAVAEKRARLAFEHIEDDVTWELLFRVGDRAGEKALYGFEMIIGLAGMAVQAVSVLALLFAQIWWAAIVILLSAVPLFFVAVKSGEKDYKASGERDKNFRRANYFRDILTDRENVEERALFSYSESIDKDFISAIDKGRKVFTKTLGHTMIRRKFAGLITILISLIIMSVLIPPLGSGALTIGLFIGLVTGTLSLVNMLSWSLGYHTSEMTGVRMYFNEVAKLASLSETRDALCAASMATQPGCIEFVNVSFRYPQTDVDVLKNLSMKLFAGKHYAFVGINGAGKTTITKLLTGLYDTYEGDIFIDGRNLKTIEQAEIKGLFGVVYQDFAKYSVSLFDNIAMGNLRNPPSEAQAKAAAHIVGLDEAIAGATG